MPDEDEVFAEIARQEFGEDWTGSIADAPTESIPDQPLPDFHLNLYDDDESYRQVPPGIQTLSIPTRWGLGLVGLGLIITILQFTPWHLPSWSGWLAIACFVGGVFVTIWQITKKRQPDLDEYDEEGTV